MGKSLLDFDHSIYVHATCDVLARKPKIDSQDYKWFVSSKQIPVPENDAQIGHGEKYRKTANILVTATSKHDNGGKFKVNL